MTQGRKILRIGIIQNGKIIEERLLRKREAVTVGQSAKNTFVLPSGGIPRSFTLFELRGGVYHLKFKSSMRGKVSVEDAVLDLESLRSRQLARAKGDNFLLPLSSKSRGKVVIGDVTLLFQFVTPPPPPSKLQLPASARGGWFRSIDLPFLGILLSSCVFQVFSIAFIVTRDYPEPPRGIETLPDRFVKYLIDEPKANKPTPTETKEDEGDEEKGKGEEKKIVKKKEPVKPSKKVEDDEPDDGPKGKPLSAEEIARRSEERQRRIAENVRNRTVLGQLGTLGGEGEGSIVDALKGGAADVSMAAAFDGASGTAIADRDGFKRDRRGTIKGTGKVAGIKDDLKRKGGDAVGTGSKGKEIEVKGSVKIKKPSEAFGTGSLDSAKIAGVVRRRQGSIKSCYEKQLKKNPKLEGKVKIQFTIEESGRVGEVKTMINTTGDPVVASCIEEKIQRFRFPKPSGGSVTVAFPFVFAPAG
ncbi:AgmX/PglI C-terminal domain-containing protein [Myxococcota bacterium]|nr:AgmX/PglI C-terminal domain-containing protein [Myxococcota bacterium]